jgi:hypothetical protein
MILYLGVTIGAFCVIHHYWTKETQKTIYFKKK